MARPTERKLKEKCLKLATELGIEIDVDKDYSKLEALAADLTAKVKDAKTVTQADTAKPKAKEEAPKAASKPKVVKPPYTVAKGKSLSTLKGVRVAGDEIKAEWVGGGQDTIDSLVKKEYVEKN